MGQRTDRRDHAHARNFPTGPQVRGAMSTRCLSVALAFAVAACHAAPSPSTPSAAPPGPPAAPESAAHATEEHAQGAGAHGHRGGAGWDAIYRDGTGFRVAPNQLLVDAVRGVAPGKALDVGMGQGRNAVFLAQQGWDVTGVDTSAEGLRIAHDSAAAAGVQVHGVLEDVATYDLGKGRWDLIALIYMGDRALLERIKAAVAPGGLVVIEWFHEDSNGYFPHPIQGFRTGELERAFAGFSVVRSETVEGVADFGQRPAKLVRFVARKAS